MPHLPRTAQEPHSMWLSSFTLLLHQWFAGVKAKQEYYANLVLKVGQRGL
jgi:hypothetical protein